MSFRAKRSVVEESIPSTKVLSKRSFDTLRLLRMTWLVLFFVIFLFFPPTVSAANFTTDYRVTYQAAESGITHAVLQITLTNTSSDFYATSYKMQLGFDDIQNIKASDPDGPINPTITKTTDGYAVDLRFNKRAVGLGNKLTFTVEFDTPSLAKQYGKIWEINIPGIANAEEFSSFTVEVKVPPSFGKAAYIKPEQNNNNLIFTKEQLGKSGISIAFGDKQWYQFALTYHIRNTNVYPITTEIALPPTTNYQEVSIMQIQPAPANVIEDKDGNWLAQYKLAPAQQLDILVTGKVEISLTPKQQPLSPNDYEFYLREQPYWQTKSPEIQKLAQELKTPEAIYQYVADTLKYDFSRVTDDKPRLGALDSLKNPKSAVCREFTDLFIAIARAAGIPAREIDGFAFTENARQRPLSLVKDILHAWPEYYDKEKQTWIMIDPTWASTTGGTDYFRTLDYDHFAFVIKGQESNYPVPAGGYKYEDTKDIKDVNVTFTQDLSDKSTSAEITTSIPKRVMGGFPVRGTVSIKNTGTTYIPSQLMYILSDTLTPRSQMLTTSGIPPFGMAHVNASFQPTKPLTNQEAKFSIRLGETVHNQIVFIAPLVLNAWIVGGTVVVTLLIVLFILFKRRR